MNNNLLLHFKSYTAQLAAVLESFDWSPVCILTEELYACWQDGRQVFIAGNGGSAGNANHIANDFIYPISKTLGSGIRMHSLSENPSILTCLANDEGYDSVFSHQLAVLAHPNDVLIVLSGSGNSPNILKALEQAKRMGVRSYAILGYSGGKAKALADVPIHFTIDDMQIAEDCQTIVFHMIMKFLASKAVKQL